MMDGFKRWRGLAAFASMATFVAALALAPPAQAQEEDVIDEIIVTGSAIKRADLDSALPVQVITSADLDEQGITNAADLIERLPSMQGFITESDSVGGGGGGIRTANLRAIGSQYTLSLLNGRRMAPADSGSFIDLSNVPLAAVEQIHVLTDGASALYGSDAIAGVVNFMLKDSVDQTTVNLRADSPREDGGEHWNFDVVTGFGDLGEDGYSVVLSYSHERQDQLRAADRDFAKTGFIFFDYAGETMYFQNSSPNSIPGNAFIYDEDWNYITDVSPYMMTHGSCAEQTTPDGNTCRFDYTSTLEVLPESERDSLTLNGRVDINDNMQGFGTLLVSNYNMIARIAPYPTGEIPLPLDSDLVVNEVLPWLSDEVLAQVGNVTGTWRALPAGGRTYDYDIGAMQLTAGVEGDAGDIDYSVALTHATTEITLDYPNGHLLLDEFVEAGSSGAFNIFAGQDEFSESDMAALAPTVFHGNFDNFDMTMTMFDTQASKPIWDIDGRDVILAAGFDYRTTNYDRKPSQANLDEILLFLSKDTAYDLDRSQWGLFAEAFMPLTDTVEATVSLRYDDIAAVEDKLNGTGDIDAGDSGVTYKLSGRWNAADWVAVRASYGTGFKAPSMREIGEPLSEFGVTSGTFDCPFSAPDPLAQYCRPQEAQYDVYRQGSGLLKFEKSKQYTFGVVMSPSDRTDITIDYWNIELEDLVERLTESQIFNNAEQYRHLFTTKTNLATGQEFLAIIQAAENAGTKEQSGIDYMVNHGIEMDWGQLDLTVQGTYMLDSESSLTGSSLGRFGNDDAVVFRNLINVMANLRHGDFTHNLNFSYRSGYTDQAQEVEITGTGVPLGQGPEQLVQLEIPHYILTNYNLKYMMLDDSLELTLGVNNMFDKKPPLSLRVSGAGHQVGWDPRYYDAYGRTIYLQGTYSFDLF